EWPPTRESGNGAQTLRAGAKDLRNRSWRPATARAVPRLEPTPGERLPQRLVRAAGGRYKEQRGRSGDSLSPDRPRCLARERLIRPSVWASALPALRLPRRRAISPPRAP